MASTHTGLPELYELADRLYDAKDAAVDRARKSKKKGKVHPVVALHKMFVHQNDYLIAVKKRWLAQHVYTWAQRAADAQHIAMLQFKVGCLSRLLRVSRNHKKRRLGSPSARFKFGPRR
jgi:hypothetical protein